ncbi:MAG TPA: hypothetical protein VGG74_21245 [Kofleriaceae bacterium]
MKSPTFNDKKWRVLAASIVDSARKVAKVGVFSGTEADGTSLADVLAFQEFGTATIPERRPLRRTFEEKRAELVKVCEGAAKQVVLHGMSVARAVGLIGAWGAGAVKATITQGDLPPPLAPATIAAKGSSKPLVDTGRLLGAITWSVVDEADAKGGVGE